MDSDALWAAGNAGDGDLELVAVFGVLTRLAGRSCGFRVFSCTLRLGVRLRGAFNLWRVIEGMIGVVQRAFVENGRVVREKV